MIAKGTKLYNIYDHRTYEILRTEALTKRVVVHYRCLDCTSVSDSYIITDDFQNLLKNIEYGNFVEIK